MNKINLSFFGTSLGYSISLFFIPLMVLKITHSPLMVSISYALDVLPYLFFTPFIGWIGDKFNKKKVIILGEVFCLISSLILFFTPLNSDFAYLIIFIGFVISSFSALHHSIFQSIIPDLYIEEELPKANANIATVSSITGIIAPVIISSALSFSYLDNRSIIIFMIFCYLLSIFAFALIRYHHQPHNQNVGIFSRLAYSWQFIQQNTQLKHFSYLFFFANFGLKMVFVSLIWIYANTFKMENNQIAFHFIMIGLFSILGAKIAGLYIVPKFESKKVIISALLAISLLTLSLPLANNGWILTFIWGLVSLLSMFIVVSYFTFRQKNTPKDILGSVISITRLISYLAIPPSAILAGYITQQYQNENIIYGLAGLIMLISCLFFYFRLKEQ